MFEAWAKKRAIKKYIKRLPRLLSSRYGSNDFYTFGQVNRTIEEHGFSKAYLDYALVLFLNENDAIENIGNEERYNKILSEVAKKYFGGNKSFNLVALSKRSVGNVGHSSMGPTSEAFHD